MSLKEKVTELCNMWNITQEKLSEELELNYQVMNRNIKANKITIDFILRMSIIHPEVDLNWLIKDEKIQEVSEPTSLYPIDDPIEIISTIEKKLAALKLQLNQK